MNYNVLITSNNSDISVRKIVPVGFVDGDVAIFPPELLSSPDDVNGTSAADVGQGYGLAESIILGLILSSFIFLALAGNALVMVAILTDRHLRKTSNYFIVSLAVADALVALVVMTFSLVNDILGRWVFGRTLCNIWVSSDVMCSTASIMNLCAISLDRYIHIRNPLHYETWVTQNRTLVVISCIWVLSALISFLPIQLGWHRARVESSLEDEVTDDEVFICALDLNPLYAVLSSIVSFYLPCMVMILIYIKLYHYAKIHVKRIRRDEELLSKINSCDATSASASDIKTRMTEHKAAVTLGVIMGVFLVCWAPFFTANIVGAFCHSCIPSIVFSTFTWLGYVNSTMNPIIYSIFNQEFSQAFKRVLAGLRFRGVSHAERGAQERNSDAHRLYGAPDRIEMNGCGYGTTMKPEVARCHNHAPVVSL